MTDNSKTSKTLALAENIINRHMVWAMASGAIPLPIIDAIGVMFIQNDMIKQLCHLYDFDYYNNIGKAIVSSIISSSAARGISFLIRKPKAADRIMMAILSGAFTYAMGKMFISNFEKGISLINIDLKKGEELFDDNFDQGQEFATELIKKKNK